MAAAALAVGFAGGAVAGFGVLAATPGIPNAVVAVMDDAAVAEVASVEDPAPVVPTEVSPPPPSEVVPAPVPVAPPPPPVAAVPPKPLPPTPVPAAPAKPPRPKDSYLGLRYDVDQARIELQRRRGQGEDVTADGMAAMDRWLPKVIDAWKGTRWSYSGTTQTPKKGAIACGYFVSTVLLHAGFKVDRVDLARQASEQIVRTVVPDPAIERFYNQSQTTVVKRVEAIGRGVYLVGLDTHIGFLVNAEKSPVKFCHSTKRNRRMGVVCETAKSSPSLESRYTVLGKLASPELLVAWLDGATLPSARKNVAQADVIGGGFVPMFSKLAAGISLLPRDAVY